MSSTIKKMVGFFLIISSAAVNAGDAGFSIDTSVTYSTIDLKKSSTSLVSYVPTSIGYVPVLNGNGVAIDGSADNVVTYTGVNYIKGNDNNRVKFSLGGTHSFSDVRQIDANGVISNKNNFEAFDNINIGVGVDSIDQENKSNISYSFGASRNKAVKETMLNIGAGYNKRFDAIELGLDGDLSYQPGNKESSDYIGSLLTVSPSITFVPNDSDRITGGVKMLTRFPDVKNGQELDVRRSDNVLFLSASHRMSKKDYLVFGVETGSSSSLGTSVTSGWNHSF